MHIETLKVFRDLADSGSFTKAAELNYVSQSAVSQQIKKLEQILKCRLIERAGGELRLTSCGAVLYKTSRNMISAYEGMLSSLKSSSAVVEGNVRIAAIYSVGTYVLQDYIKRFIKRCPLVKINIEYRKARQIYSDIIAGHSDLSIMAYPGKHSRIDTIPLCNEEMVLICPPGHEFSKHASISIRQLNGIDFISFEKLSPTRKSVDDLLRRHKVRLRARMELDNIESIKTAVETGTGLSIVPVSTVKNEELQGRLNVVRFSNTTLTRPLYVLVKRGRKFSPAVQAFINLLKR